MSHWVRYSKTVPIHFIHDEHLVSLKNKEYKAGDLSDVTNAEVDGIEDKEIYEVIV